MNISNLQACILMGFTTMLGYGMRKKGYKISGDIAIAIGLLGIVLTLSYKRFYSASDIYLKNPYFVLFIVCVSLLFVSILLRIQKFKPKPALPPPTSKPSVPLSQAEKSMARVSEINRLTKLLKKTENEIAVEQAIGDYLFKLPELLKKKEQYLQELEKLGEKRLEGLG